MRLRNLLTATAVTALSGALAVGALSVPAHAVPAPSPADAGSVVAWGNEEDPSAAAASLVPEDLTGLVASVAANDRTTAAVTLDGRLHVWGVSGTDEVDGAPTDVTDATAVAFTAQNGAILHTDGKVTAWGTSTPLSEVPSDLRAKAIAITSGTGYAVRPDGTLATWGDASTYPAPETGLTDLVDVSASLTHVLALHADGTVSIWGGGLPGLLDIPDFGGKKVVQISAGFGASGVVLADGTIKTWGFAPFLPAGEPTFDGLTPATTVVDLDLYALAGNAAAVTADGAVHAWGSNTAITEVPESLTGQPVSAVAVGNAHAVAIVTTFRDVTKPTIAGTPTVGQTLTATPATFSLTPDAPATGQWYAGADPIAGKTATTLVLEAAQLGKQISYRSTATRGQETVTSASAATAAVTLVNSTTTLSVAPAKGAVGTARTVTATVAKTGGTPTGTVTFTTGATTGTAALAAGKATWTLPTSLKVGTHQVTASYAGDTTTNPSTATALTVTVTKATAKVTAKAKAKGKTTKVAKKVTITVTVKAPKGISAAGKVTITLKGKTKVKPITVKVNAKGIATATVKNLKHGKYKATIKYAGNTSINKASGTATFKA